jgi:hypothetical protein
LLLLVSLLVSASGCALAGGEKLLVFTTYTRTGIHIGAVNGQPVSALLGHKRFEGAILPVRPKESRDIEVDLGNGETVDIPSDLSSVYAALRVDNRWFGGLDIEQHFATGAAAVRMARSGGVVSDAGREEDPE